MFVALRAKDRTRVTSIAPEWESAEDLLRELAASGELICPGCEQPLWFRAGVTRRRHFAHRSLADCPLEHQSAEVMEIKAQLYQWLETKYPGKVHLEVSLSRAGFDRVFDLVVEPEEGRKFAYLVFDRQQRDRDDIFAFRGMEGLHLHFVHASSTLNTQTSGHLLLTASQRDFIQNSDYDKCATGIGRGHLLYFRPEDSTAIIYRGLCCVHEPNVYRYSVERAGPLGAALISPKTGEIVFPEDAAARKAWRQKIFFVPAPVVESETASDSAYVETEDEEPSVSEVAQTLQALNGPFKCSVCGIMTQEWSEATPSEGTCVCHHCVKERHRTRLEGGNITKNF